PPARFTLQGAIPEDYLAKNTLQNGFFREIVGIIVFLWDSTYYKYELEALRTPCKTIFLTRLFLYWQFVDFQ
ncbi:MAG: hypothetical protein IKX34_05560, partial [Bacteroidales bacterium]|nr:hypothetical protein [Bacteroidales bacterium]